MSVLTKQNKLSLLALLISVLCIPTIYAPRIEMEVADDREVELVATEATTKPKKIEKKKKGPIKRIKEFFASKSSTKEGPLFEEIQKIGEKKQKIKRIYVMQQSEFIKNMLVEYKDEEKIPRITLPKISPKDLEDIIELMEKGYEYKDKEDKNQKQLLAKFIEEKKWDINKLTDLLLAANYLNAPLILKALAYEIADKKIDKKILDKLPTEILFEIQTQYILRHYKLPIFIFDRKITQDLLSKKLYKTLKRHLSQGKFVKIYYDDKGKVQLGDTVEISKYIQGFKGFLYIASGSYDKTIKLWNIETGKCAITFKGPDKVYSVAFSPDGKKIASGLDNQTIELWDIKTGKREKKIKEEGRPKGPPVRAVAFSPDGTKIASWSYYIKLWNVETGEREKTLKGPDEIVYSVAFSPDGKKIASGLDKQTIELWDIKTGKREKTFKKEGRPKGPRVRAVAFSPDGKKIASSGSDDIKLWNVETGKCEKTLKGPDKIVYSVAFSPDGKKLLLGGVFYYWGSGGIVELWDIETGKREKTFEGHTDQVNSVAFSPDGTKIASGSKDQTVKLWDIKTGECEKTFEGHKGPVTSVAFGYVLR
ncbi:hypothetical protein ACFLYA_02065 [Candidatus Dependentiae bacterium]